MLNKYEEYNEIIEAMLKATGNFEIFKDFEQKIEQRSCTPEQLRQTVLVLTSLAEAVKDNDLKLELYEKIIQELVIYLFKVDVNAANTIP